MAMFKLSGRRPRNLGVVDGRLAACPRKPNAVCSQAPATDRVHAIAPLAFTGDATAAMQRLKRLVETSPGATIVASRADYLHAEFSTPLLGFVDDVEFWCDGAAIQVRSASRLGYSDLGVNRRRVEQLRAAFAQA
jgi:uncharacterized protein (DUF1499 family)